MKVLFMSDSTSLNVCHNEDKISQKINYSSRDDGQ
jgi:hypothetical protein